MLLIGNISDLGEIFFYDFFLYNRNLMTVNSNVIAARLMLLHVYYMLNESAKYSTH